MRAISLLAVFAVMAETPKGCANQDKGPGEYENVKVNPKHSARPGNPATHDRKRKVTLTANWSPKREVTITWVISGTRKSFQWYQSPWSRTNDTHTGDRVELTVENHGSGGFTQCEIRVDGVKMTELEGEPYVHRNDAGDCKVWIVVP